jgi:N-acetylglucosamine kinase-like BadF-type ATPase
LDAGGTKTDYVLADETRELERVRIGTIKRMRTDAATATRNLEQALSELTARTGISMQSMTRTCVGTAGVTVRLVADWLREAITVRVAGGLLVLGDVEIALDAAFPGQAGVLVLSGTGSNVAGHTATLRAGLCRWLGPRAGGPGTWA